MNEPSLRRLALALVTLAALAACSDSSSDETTPAEAELGCRDVPEAGFCTQYLLADEGDLEEVQESCALGGLREVISSCPAQDVAGCCVLETAQYVAHQCYYPPTTTEMVQDQCETLGQAFVAAP